MPIVDGKYVAPTWVNGGEPAINATELNAMSTTIQENQENCSDLKSALSDVNEVLDLTANGNKADFPTAWSQASIYYLTGANSTSSVSVRTDKFKIEDYKGVTIPSPYSGVFFAYAENGAYLGAYNPTDNCYANDTSPFGVWNLAGRIDFNIFESARSTITGQESKAPYNIILVLAGTTSQNLNEVSNLTFTYSDSHRLENIETGLSEAQTTISDVLEPFSNMANPDDKIDGGVWSDANVTYPATGYSRAELQVDENNVYSIDNFSGDFSWFVDASNNSLGKITQNVFTTPSGCVKIRISKHSLNPYVIIKGDMGWTTKADRYADFAYGVIRSKAIEALEIECADLDDRVTALEDADSVPLTSMSVFATIGAIGDSYTSGGIYGVSGVSGGAYYKVSWPQILARKCGFDATNYSKSGMDVSAWLADSTYGLPALEGDTAKDLYIITLGINQEKQIADPTANASIGTTADIDLSDPSQNADTFCGHYGKMLSAIIAHAPDAKIILVQPLLTSAEKLTAIANIATLFGVPYFRMSSDGYYSTDFYTDNLHTSHPIALTYAGMALAFERQITKCMIDNVSYFTDCH